MKETASTLLFLATVVFVIAAATFLNTGVIYHEAHFANVDPSSRELNMLPIRGR